MCLKSACLIFRQIKSRSQQAGVLMLIKCLFANCYLNGFLSSPNLCPLTSRYLVCGLVGRDRNWKIGHPFEDFFTFGVDWNIFRTLRTFLSLMWTAIQVLDKLDSPEKTGRDILINWWRQSGQAVQSELDDKVFHLNNPLTPKWQTVTLYFTCQFFAGS